MVEKIKWGIIGPGRIARKFADGLTVLDDAELVAIASRTKDSADRFAGRYNIKHSHKGYEALATNPEVDVVYVATPHPFHKDCTLLCLNHGKAVLCEKPFAINRTDAEEMIECARTKGLFLMEGMWTHFFPAMIKVRELLAEGAIGEVRMLNSSFCFRCGWDPEGRLLNPALGGGGLLDIGVYNISLAHMVFGRAPERIVSMAHIGKTGVDEQAVIVLGYDTGAMATLQSAVQTSMPDDAAIYGTEGYIKIPSSFWQPDRIIVGRDGKEEEITFERLGNGFGYEALDVMDCLRADKLESDIMPHAKTLAVMEIMDSARAQWGLTYPME